MRKSEYTRRRKEIEQERVSLADSLAKVEAKLAALDLVWTEVYKSGGEPCDASVATTAQDENSEHRQVVHNGHAQELIDEAALRMTGEFGVKDVEQAIHSVYAQMTVNRTTIAGRLKKLVVDRKIELVQAGIGRRPGKFKGASSA